MRLTSKCARSFSFCCSLYLRKRVPQSIDLFIPWGLQTWPHQDSCQSPSPQIMNPTMKYLKYAKVKRSWKRDHMSKHTTCALAKEMYMLRQILASLSGNQTKIKTKKNSFHTSWVFSLHYPEVSWDGGSQPPIRAWQSHLPWWQKKKSRKGGKACVGGTKPLWSKFYIHTWLSASQHANNILSVSVFQFSHL